MTITTYSSLAEVTAFTRHLLDGQTTFNSDTRPAGIEVSKFIERASSILNVALEGVGLDTPITQATAKSACDDWVTARAVRYVEMTQRGVGYSGEEGSRSPGFGNLFGEAAKFAAEVALGFKRLGVTVSYKSSDGLQFTGMDAISERADPDDSTLRQPVFRRGLYDEPEGSGPMDSDNEDEE